MTAVGEACHGHQRATYTNTASSCRMPDANIIMLPSKQIHKYRKTMPLLFPETHGHLCPALSHFLRTLYVPVKDGEGMDTGLG